MPHPPVWFMRQAGRALPEYRAAREGIAMLQACIVPELVAELTMQPVRRYGVDAAIIFSDIVVPLKAIGVDLDIVAGVGPVVATPISHQQGRRPSCRPLEPGRRRFPCRSSASAGRRARMRRRSSGSPARRSRSPAISSKAARRATTLKTKSLMYSRARTVARPARPARDYRDRIPARSGRRRRERRPTVRLMGRHLVAVRLSALRDAAQRARY